MTMTSKPYRSLILAASVSLFWTGAAIADSGGDTTSKAMLQVAQAGMETIWDYRFDNGVRLQRVDPQAGILLPDGSMVVAVNEDEKLGPYVAYRIAADGRMLARMEVFDGTLYGRGSANDIVLVPDTNGPAEGAKGVILVGGPGIGPRRFDVSGRSLDFISWAREVPYVASAFAAAPGAAWIGGGEKDINSGPPCSRAMVVRVDSQGKEQWRWYHEKLAQRATYVRGIARLADGSLILHVSTHAPTGYSGGSMPTNCREHPYRHWFIRLSPTGVTSWIRPAPPDEYYGLTALPDGRFAVAGLLGDRAASQRLFLRIVNSRDGSLLVEHHYDFDILSGLDEHDSVPSWPIGEEPVLTWGLLTAGHYLYIEVTFTTQIEHEGTWRRILQADLDGNVQWVSPKLRRGAFFGAAADGSTLFLADQDGVKRLFIPRIKQ